MSLANSRIVLPDQGMLLPRSQVFSHDLNIVEASKHLEQSCVKFRVRAFASPWQKSAAPLRSATGNADSRVKRSFFRLDLLKRPTKLLHSFGIGEDRLAAVSIEAEVDKATFELPSP